MSKAKRKVKFYPGNGSPFRTIKTSRNQPCDCGSGKKAKACCGTETRMFHEKPTPEPKDKADDLKIKKA
jgi:hypothetical protein